MNTTLSSVVGGGQHLRMKLRYFTSLVTSDGKKVRRIKKINTERSEERVRVGASVEWEEPLAAYRSVSQVRGRSRDICTVGQLHPCSQ